MVRSITSLTCEHLIPTVNIARETLIADLNKSEEDADEDDNLLNKILLDEQNLNAAIQQLNNFQETGNL
jgi:hypothetical protein